MLFFIFSWLPFCSPGWTDSLIASVCSTFHFSWCPCSSHPASDTTIVEVNLKVSDIGCDWVYLTWDKSAGDLSCNNKTYKTSNEMINKTSMNVSNVLETGISYDCSIGSGSILDSMKLRNNSVNFTLGAGIVKTNSDHDRVIAHFVGDKNSTRLSCTVMNGDIQTDTVWSVAYKNGTKNVTIKSNELFSISGDRRQSSLEFNFTYENHLYISDCSVEELDGAVISCGSHVNRSQVNVSLLFVCDEPDVMSESTIEVWERHVGCSIDVMTSNLKASNHKLLKDEDDTRGGISVNSFSVTFDEVKKEDAGNYFAEFCIPCHKDSSPKCFNHTFYLNVMYGPTLSEVQTKYSFSKGEQADLVIGENLESNPKSVVTWTSPQGITFKESNGRYIVSGGPEKVQLSISNVSERDNGTWTVTVEVLSTETFKNCSDQNSSSRKKEFLFLIQLIIVVPPSEPRNLTVEEIDNSTLLVRWEEPLNHGSPYLSGYELCYNSTCEQTTTETGTELSLDRGNLYNISVYAISKSDNATEKSPPTSMMFTMDYVHDFKVVDIGHNWVYLSWDKLNPSCGTSQQHYNVSCIHGETSFNFTTMETFYNIYELSTNVSISCSVVAISSDNTTCSLYSSPVDTTPG